MNAVVTDAWSKKGATLSDKSARAEFGLTQREIITAIQEGKLQYREGSVYGNPFLRLLRREVEQLVSHERGPRYLKKTKIQRELDRTNTELRALKTKVRRLESKKAELQASLDKS
jgi:hypothetical protein